MSLPYRVCLPLTPSEKANGQRSIVISDIASIMTDRENPNRSVIFMNQGKGGYHFIDLSVEEVTKRINDTLDGADHD